MTCIRSPGLNLGGRGCGLLGYSGREASRAPRGMMLTLRTNDFRHVLPELVKHIQESGVTPRLVRIEGVMGVGKSPLADMLADALDAASLPTRTNPTVLTQKRSTLTPFTLDLRAYCKNPRGRFSKQYVWAKWRPKMPSAKAL